MVTVDTQSASATLALNPGSRYVWRVSAVTNEGAQYTDWSEPFVATAGGGIAWSTAPLTPTDPGSEGDIAYNDDYFFVRTSQGWRRTALSAWGAEILISSQPQNTTVGDGGSATFTVLANAPEAISYQWSSSIDGASFAAINGATSNTLTVNATLSGNGSQYRALLSAAGAADVMTNVATLTVNETFRLLTANNDTLLTEAGDTLNHDGVGGGGGGNQPSDDWEQDGAAFSISGRVYGYSPDADILYWPTDTTSSGFAVQGLQRYERDANGTFSAVGNAVNTGWNTLETVPGISSSADGSKVIVTNDQSTGSDSGTYALAGYTVYEYANGTLSSVYSGSQDSYTLVAISRDGGVWAVYRDDGTVRVESASGTIGTPFSTGYDVYHVALNNDGSKFAMSRYGDVTSDGNADAYTQAYQWTGSAWVQMGSDFLSAANVSGGAPSQPIAFSSSGSRIAVGFSTESGDHAESGVVRVYDWSGSAWSQAGSDISGAAAYDLFGSSVSLSSDGTRLAVGARGNDSAASNAGRTSVYQYSAGSWFKIGTDIDGPASTNAYAGSSVFLSSDGNYLGVGASGAETLTRYGLQTNQITITQQPQDATYSGSPVTFSTSATVSDNSTPAYQWEYSADNGSTWTAISNATATNLTLDTVGLSDNGTQYRAVVSANRAPDATTDAATLTVSGNLIVQAAPQNTTVAAGDDATFSATLEPAENWYVYDMKWERADSGSPNSWSVVETESIAGYDISSSSNVTQNYTWSSASSFDDGDLFRVTGSAFEYGLAHTSGALASKHAIAQGKVEYRFGSSVSDIYFSVTQGGTIQAQYYQVDDGYASENIYNLFINSVVADYDVEAFTNEVGKFGATHTVSPGDQIRINQTRNVAYAGIAVPRVILLFTPTTGIQTATTTSAPATLTVT